MSGIDEKSESKIKKLQDEAYERGCVKINLTGKKEMTPSSLAIKMKEQIKSIVSESNQEDNDDIEVLIKKIKPEKKES